MIITWDEKKNRQNKMKHRLSFETAQLVFDDPLHVSVRDPTEGDEEGWRTMGLVGSTVVLFVAHSYAEYGGNERIRTYFGTKSTKEREGPA